VPDQVRPATPIELSDEVATALAEGRPVVALESTIIAHGLPRPRNLAVARDLEELLRASGATPATVAVVDGVARVGLGSEVLERIAADDTVVKASVRDLPVALATGLTAATTVASTALLAHRAGIAVFATGGLGGVHREAARTFDESADLHVLARVPIVVVSAGVKSILDVPATLERLETLGITVLGYRTDRFPGFTITDSGHEAGWRVETPAEVASVLAGARALALDGAVLVANPIDPAEQLDPDLHDGALAEALAEAERLDVRGKEVTPFLLDHLQRTTEGASLEANVRAVTGNVRLAGEIATAWAAQAR
jgi:pseudouridine-5'-phosphate glycosidase